MVLQPIGCGRVGHRHNTRNGSGQSLKSLWPLLFDLRYVEEAGLCLLNLVGIRHAVSFSVPFVFSD